MPSGAQPGSPTYFDYAGAVDALREQYAAIPPGSPVRLAKRTSNLFRQRSDTGVPGLDVERRSRACSRSTPSRARPTSSAMTTYEDLVAATLPHGLVPLCVPQLRTITLGGAVTGLGIESASWRNGCPHESVLDLDVLTGDGRVVTATADQRARRPVPRLPQLLRLAGLRAAPAHRARAGHAVRRAAPRVLRRRPRR